MNKIEISPKISPYPMPIVIVGSMINDHPNFMTAAWFNRFNGNPPIWGIALGKNQYTLEGIKKNRNLSLNIPSLDLVDKVDYCGIVSGRNTNKSILFNIFYGKLESVPMIQECPLCLECNVYDLIELPSTVLVLCEIISAYTEDRYMNDGKLDPKKINPILLTQPDNHYWGISDIAADAFSIGKTLLE